MGRPSAGPTTPTLATAITSTDVTSCSGFTPKARRQSYTASVRSPLLHRSAIPSQGWSSTRKETCMGSPGWAGITTPAPRAAKVSASYSSSLQKARRQSCTSSAREQLRRSVQPPYSAGPRREGSMYGTTQLGGAPGGGVVFKLIPEGKETVLHGFCWQVNCADGQQPNAGLIFDQRETCMGRRPMVGLGSTEGASSSARSMRSVRENRSASACGFEFEKARADMVSKNCAGGIYAAQNISHEAGRHAGASVFWRAAWCGIGPNRNCALQLL